jgi:hypothetical protein
MHRVFTTILLCSLSWQAVAQASPPAQGSDFPWVWVIVALLALAGGIWWYMTRIRGRP